MSKPVFSDLFSFSTRRNRKSYLLLTIALLVPNLIASVIINVAPDAALVVLIVLLPLIIIGLSSAVQRLHDADKSGLWMLFMLVPIANLILTFYLLFAKGTPGQNTYGPDPTKGYGVAQFG